MSKLKVLMFGCSSNLLQRFDRKHSSGISASLQSHDIPTAKMATQEECHE